MRPDARTTDSPQGPASCAVAGALSLLRSFDRTTLLDSLGLACYIAWSFVFWNGSVLSGGRLSSPSMDRLFMVQCVFTAFTALLVALSVRRASRLRAHAALLAAFAFVSGLSVVVVALVGYGGAPLDWMWAGFALSGVGSALRLGWGERLSMGGVARTARCAGCAYLVGFMLFSAVSLLPPALALAASALLPFGSFALLVMPEPVDARASQHSRTAFRELLAGIPWKLVAAIALAFFSYGATRMRGVTGGVAALDAGQGAVAGIPALACFFAIALAFVFYRKNALLAFYLAFPLMGVAAVVPASLDPLGGLSAFCIALAGAELVKYLVWFLLIDSIIKDGLSALLCLALMRFAQWGGSCLGQVAADAAPTQDALSIAVLVSLLAALLVIMGVPLRGSRARADDERGGDLASRVDAAAACYRLSPREQEVLALWATGRTSAYLEKRLFISKSTVKTHLNHIYAKTGAANRDELLELLENMREQGRRH